MLLHCVCWNVTHMYLIALSVHMLVRYRFLSSSHFNHIAANVCHVHSTVAHPIKTLPHESDHEDDQCADTDPIQDEVPANIENKNDEIPMLASVNNVKQENVTPA